MKINNTQPDLIQPHLISYTLFFTSTILPEVLSLCDLFNAQIITIGFPMIGSRNAVMNAKLRLPTENLSGLLLCLPFDLTLPDHLRPLRTPPPKPSDETVPF